MNYLNELSRRHFARAAKLGWTDDIQFDFADWTPNGGIKSIIYAYIDTGKNRLLYIGETGNSFEKRSRKYRSWLNGNDKRRNAPINGKWLNCLLGECTSLKVEVWVKQSDAEKARRKVEESDLIRMLRPILNTKA